MSITCSNVGGMQHDWVLARCSVAQAAVGYPIESARAAMGSPSAQSASRLCSADSAQLSKPDTCTSRLLDVSQLRNDFMACPVFSTHRSCSKLTMNSAIHV